MGAGTRIRVLAALVLAALAFAACGGDDGKRPVTPLDDALGYFAADAAFVAAVETDPEGAQIRQLAAIAGRFPAAAAAGLSGRIADLTRFRFVRWSRDVRPQLGAPLVIGLEPLVIAMRMKSPLRAKQVLLRQPGFRARGKASGMRIWENPGDERYAAVDGDVLVVATRRSDLARALARRRGDERMREEAFKRDLAGLPTGGLMRISADPRALIAADPRLRPALELDWPAALRRSGAVVKAASGGITLDFRMRTDAGALDDGDLPLPTSAKRIALLGDRDEIQIGVREPQRLARLAFEVWRRIAPRSLERFRSRQPRGIDLERQIPRHLTGSASFAFDPLDKSFALRADLDEAADVREALVVLAPALPDLAALLGMRGLGLATPESGESFFALAKPNGRTVVFGVLGRSLVAASEARRAADLLSEPARYSPAGGGALVVTADMRELAGRLLADRLDGPAGLLAPLAVSALRDLSGSVTSARDGLRGYFKLTIAG